MSQIGKHITCYINSRDRENPETSTSSNFDYNLSQVADLSEFDRISLLWCTVSKSYYLIEAGVNDTFSLVEDTDTFTVTIPEGNYNFTSLGTEIQTQLNSVGNFTYAVTPVVKLAKYTITVSDNGAVQPSLVMNSFINEIIGFQSGATYDFTGDTLTSPNVVRLQRTEALSLWCNLVDTPESSLQELFTANQVDSSIFQVHNLNPYQWSHPLKQVKTNLAHFELRDYNTNQLVGLNGLNIQMQIMFYRQDFSKQYMVNRLRLKDAMLGNDEIVDEDKNIEIQS